MKTIITTCILTRLLYGTLAVGLLFLESGCMTPAQQLEESAVVGQLHAGQSQAEVRKLFGQPKRSEAGSTGKSLDVFVVIFPRSTPSSVMRVADVRSLHVLYDTQNEVEKFSYHIGEMRGFGARRGELWQAGRPLSTDKVNQIERNITTRDQLIRMFGSATLEGLDAYGYKVMSWVFVEGRNTAQTGGRELVVRLNDSSVAMDYMLRNVRQ